MGWTVIGWFEMFIGCILPLAAIGLILVRTVQGIAGIIKHNRK